MDGLTKNVKTLQWSELRPQVNTAMEDYSPSSPSSFACCNRNSFLTIVLTKSSAVFNDQTVVPSYPIHLSHNPVAVQYHISCRLIEGTHQRRSFEVPHTPHTKPLLLHPPLLNILCQCCLHILLLRTLNLHHLPGTSADLIPAQINESRHSMRSCDIGRQRPPSL